MSLISELSAKMILPDLAATNKKEALMELAKAVQNEHPDLKTEALYTILRERESLGSTGIGEGIAIPHGKIKDLPKITICFGRSIKGVPFDSMDGKPAHLFFLLLAPESAASHYLSSLAELSRFLKNPHTREQLMQAKDKQELSELFTEAR